MLAILSNNEIIKKIQNVKPKEKSFAIVYLRSTSKTKGKSRYEQY